MAAYPSFDDISDDDDGGEVTQGAYVPFQFFLLNLKEQGVKKDSEEWNEKVLAWLNDNFDYCYQKSKDRLFTYRRLANRYKNGGDSQMSGYARTSNRDIEEKSDKPTVRTNFFVEYIDQKVSSISKNKQNPVFIPLNDSEIDDINNQEACNLLVKFRMKEIGIDAIMREQDRRTFKYGHSFSKVIWDREAGPMNPKYIGYKKKYKEDSLPVIDEETGKPVEGETITDQDAKLGDVDVINIDSDCVYPERQKKKWKDVNYVDECEFVNASELRYEYEDKEIKKEDYYWLDVENKGYNSDDTILKHKFYHKPTKWLARAGYPYGILVIYIECGILEIICEKEAILEHMPDGELPYIPDTDIDVDDDFWARPFLINIEQSNNMYDLIQSGMARNIGVASHPKLLIAEGSVNLKQADNKYGVMQWRGPHKPEWMQHNYVNRGEFEIQDRLEKRMNKAAKVFDLSKGDIPTGLTATSALRLYDDQEMQANSEQINKRRERIKKVYWKVMKFMDAKYKPDDERMAHILGEDNSYLIETFKKFDFGKIYSVDIENVSALADSRSGRVNDIIDLNAANQKEPTFGKKEIVQLLNLGLEKAFVNEISQAATTAKTILDMLKKGIPAPAPEGTDDLLEMYSIFSRFAESVSFKLKLKDPIKSTLKTYISGLEYEMANKAAVNPAFKAELMRFPKFPMINKTVGDVLVAPTGPMPAGQGPGAPAAPQGNTQAGLPNMNQRAEEDMQNTVKNNGGVE